MVIDHVDLDVRAGEILGILGPNGAGKTTLFNLISGDLRPDEGRIEFAGSVIDREPPYRRARSGIGRTYQIPRPYAAMTTFENLLVAAMFSAGRREKDAYPLCAAILRECGLERKANTVAGSLVLLERKRLELARALAGEPKLLLLDEIAGGLTEHEAHIVTEMVSQIRQRGVTIIWIEHVIHAIASVADRMMVLNFGQTIAQGAPTDVLNNADVRRVYMGLEA
jgi:branched-chain amino acid transport system ATP-binding protein